MNRECMRNIAKKRGLHIEHINSVIYLDSKTFHDFIDKFSDLRSMGWEYPLAYNTASELSKDLIKKMKILKNEYNFNKEFAYEGSLLSPTQIEIMKKLKKDDDFNDKVAYLGALLSTVQIEIMKKLKKDDKFNDNFAYLGALLLPKQIEIMKKLKKENKFDDDFAYLAAEKNFNPEQIKKMSRLQSENTNKTDGTYKKIRVENAEYAVESLSDEQIKEFIELRSIPNNSLFDNVIIQQLFNKYENRLVI